MPDYINQSQQHLLMVLEVVGQRPLETLSVKAVDEMTAGASRDQLFRALENLSIAGWAVKEKEGYRLSTRITQLSEAVRVTIAKLHQVYLNPQTLTLKESINEH